MKQKIGIQGVRGSFHHQVAQEYFGREVEVLECMSFSGLAESLQKAEADQAVMAIENSIAGSILPNYALIDAYGLQVTGEHYLPIHMNLMALPGQELEEITEVVSHPMALLQCRTFFEAHPQIRLVEDADTAEVAQRIARQQLKGIAAVAGPMAAAMYGLEVLADGIHSVKNNATRFLVLNRGNGKSFRDKAFREQEDVENNSKVTRRPANGESCQKDDKRDYEVSEVPLSKHKEVTKNGIAGKFQNLRGEVVESCLKENEQLERNEEANGQKKEEKKNQVDKVSLKFELDHVHGSLAIILHIINEHKLNLTKIQSLPIIESPWRYAFFVDVVFDAYSSYQKAYKILKAKTRKLKVIGEYKNQQP